MAKGLVKVNETMSHTVQAQPRRMGHGEDFQENVVHWGWQTTPAFMCKSPMSSMRKQKDMTLEDEPSDQKVSSVLLGKSTGQLLTAPERMKQPG